MAQDSFSYDDASKPVARGFSYEDASSEPPRRTALDVAKDVGITALKGAVGLPQSVVGLADLVTGGQAGKAVEDAGVRFKDTQAFLADQYSDAQKAANQKVAEADGFVGTAQAMLENPSTIATSVGESIPQMLGGAGVARGVLATGARVAPAIAGAIGEGVLGAGSQAEQIRQETQDGLLTPKQAALAAVSGVTTAAFGAAGGRAAQRLGIGDADTMLAQGAIRGAGPASQRSLARQVGEGVLSEGVLEEVPQSMAEQALQNLALDKPVGEGVGASAAQGLLAGGAMGGGAALVHGVGARGEPAAAAPAPAPAPDPLQLGYQPDTLVAFPDGTVGRQAEVDAYLARLPENQRAAERARLMGLSPQPSPPTTETRAGAPVARAAPLPSQAMGIDPAAGPLSTGAAIAVNSGAHGQLLQDAQRQADVAALAEQEQATAANRAAPPVLDYSDLDERDRALYDDYFRALDRETEGHIAAALADDVPDFGGRNVTDEQFLRALGANDQEIADAIQAARGAAGPEERAGGAAAPAADVTEGARPAAAAAPVQQGQVEPAQAVAAPVTPATTAPASEAPTSVQDGIARARGRRAKAPAPAAPAAAAAEAPVPSVEGRAVSTARREKALQRVEDGKAWFLSQGKAEAFVSENGLDGTHEVVPENRRFVVKQKTAASTAPAAPTVPTARPEPREPLPAAKQSGRLADGEWATFAADSGTKGVPRAQMPQIRAEHRGAMVNFMNARGIAHAEETVPADSLKPTQAEFSPERVQRASEFTGGDRAILVSSDGHVLDGHHQWLAAREKGEDVRTIRLDAPIDQLLEVAREFPSSTTDDTSAPAPAPAPREDERFPRVTSLPPMSIGPGGRVTPRSIASGRPLYRETSPSGLDDLLRMDAQADFRSGMFVTDNPDLALGQGDNTGVKVAFRPDSLSGREHAKPGTGALAGREYSVDIIAPRAVQSVEMKASDVKKLRLLTRRALSDFDRSDLAGGRVRFDRKGLAAETSSAPTPQRARREAPAARGEPAKAVPARTAVGESIQDAGEKIGGARKDRWKERGLNVSDLNEMSEAEGAELATKANIWKPDWSALVGGGMNPVTAASAKVIYDRLAAQPKDNTPAGRRRYVRMMQAVRAVYSELTPENIAGAKERLLFDHLQWTDGLGATSSDRARRNAEGVEDLAAHRREARATLFSVYKGRSDPFVLDHLDLMRVRKMVVDGFPAKGEPWSRRFGVRESSGKSLTPRGRELTLEQSAEVGTPLTAEQIAGSYFEVRRQIGGRTLAYAMTRADAEAAARRLYEAELASATRGKEPERPHLDVLQRAGLPQRLDRDATPDDFIRDFGFRGIEFGNWSAQDERQRIINMAYDGLSDLAQVMGVPPSAMSLNGTMGLAFGARGGGRFAAHYEPGRLVINMTKIRGGGSLAHEWAHALDHYFGELEQGDAYQGKARGASGWYEQGRYDGTPQPSGRRGRLANLRPELASAFDRVMSTIYREQLDRAALVREAELTLERAQARLAGTTDEDLKRIYSRGVESARQSLNETLGLPPDAVRQGRKESSYYESSLGIKEGKESYWTRPTEMFARAFESWVFDRIKAMGARSDYLVHGVESGVQYPAGLERARINEAFDQLAATIETRAGENGNTALFRRADDGLAGMSPAAADAMRALSRRTYSPQARTQAVATVRKTVDALRSAWGNAPDIVVAFDMNDAAVPEAARRADLRQRSGGARGAPEGFYYRGKAYLMASRLATPEDAARVLYHEVLGHHGLRGTFGKQLDGVLNQIATMRRAEVDAKVREYGLRGVNKLDRRAAAEEVLAEMAQNTPELHFVRRAVAAIRTWLRENVPGFRGLRLTDDEIIRNFILPARAFVERSAGAAPPRAGFAFSRAEGTDPDAESRAFLDGAPVAQMTGKEFAPDGVPISDKVTQHYATTGNAQVEVLGIGLVSLDRQAVKSSLYHGIGRDKATAFAAVPDVLKNGKIIHAEAMEGARDAGMVYHVAAPVRIGDREMVEVVLVKADSNAKRMYVHEVVLREKLRQPAVEAGAGAAGAGLQTRADAGAIRSVLDRIYSVNPAQGNPTSTDQTSTPAFRAWFGDSKVVDAQGAPLVVFHGTRADISTFALSENGESGAGVYTTADPERASIYAGDGYKAGGNVMPVYVSIQNPATRADVQAIRESGTVAGLVDSVERGREVRRQLIARGFDGVIAENPTEYVALHPEQVKSAIGNSGAFDGEEGDIRFSRSTVGEYARTAAAELNKTFSAPGRLSWWHKTIGTMYNVAERSPAFKPVFDAAQGFVDDVSHYATDAAELAPKLLPKLETWRDIKKSPISAADNTAVAKPVFEGTLTWARDEQGAPVQVQTLIDAAAGLTSEQKAQRLLRNGMLDERMLKAWQGMPLESYEKAVASRYESRMLQPGVVWSDAELRGMFQLTDDQVALYREFREATNRSLDTMARADMLRFAGDDAKGLRTIVMDAPDAQAAAVLIRDRLAQLAGDQPDRATLLMNTANGIMDRADKVRDLQARGYAPLSRFGRYSVDVVDAKGERQYFGLFETARDANTMAARMRGEFGEAAVSQGTLSEEAFKMFAGVTPETLELFGNALGLDSTGDRAQDQAFQEYLKLTKTNRSAMRRLIHRKGIAGFSEDVGRVLASFIYSNARQTAAGLNMGDLGEAVNAIPKEQGELKDVAVRLAEYVKNPQEEAQAVRGLLFAQYLGGSIASAFVNMTQPAAVTFPWLSQFGGARKAAAALGTAAKNIATKGFEFESDLAKALKTAEDEGVVAPQEVHQLMAQARGSGSLRAGDGTRLGEARAAGQNALARLSLAWGKVFGAAEQVNRRITFIAAYRVARDRGEADPAAFASRAVRETQFVYSKASKMQWGRGAVGGTLMTFKTYSIAYLELLHRMYTQGGPEGKRAALLALGMLMLMGGSGGLPFAEDAEDVADALAQLLGYNFSAKKARQEVLEAMLPKGIADFLDKGVSGLPGAPLDVSGRLGMGNLIPGTGLLQQKTSHTRDVLEIAGPAGDFASRIFSGALNVAKGNIGAGALEVAPTAVRNAAKGVDMAATGMYRDAKGYKVLETNHLEAALKAIGFQPQSVATIQEANALNQQAKAFYNLRAQEIRAEWAAGIFEKDEAKVRAAREAIAAWNAKNPDQPMLIRITDVNRRVREMAKSKDQRIADTAPRALRQKLHQSLNNSIND
ncbi:PLxRFG domain-containing protein [Variovorax sp.]|jgi:hypothetical protein|uniref:PLxRFG domain-containing protein n=1 Tax=Variovorax sp. TaxID=1871043 RepID=UPI0037D9A470